MTLSMNTLLDSTTRIPIPTALTTTVTGMHTKMIMGTLMITILENMPATRALAAR